jgi:hypothetical protein
MPAIDDREVLLDCLLDVLVRGRAVGVREL